VLEAAELVFLQALVLPEQGQLVLALLLQPVLAESSLVLLELGSQILI
jgi:hypothetical protein|tara:strand:- start:365 stop:508 length:144 start_codon:yes stop_codon:yes gene_type:complete